MQKPQYFLWKNCNIFLCEECIRLFIITSKPRNLPDSADSADNHDDNHENHDDMNMIRNKHTCLLCLGILDDAFTNTIINNVQQSFLSYNGGLVHNLLTKDSPTISIPPHLVIRAQCMFLFLETTAVEKLDIVTKRLSNTEIYAKLKEAVRSNVRSKLKDLCPVKTYASFDNLEHDMRQSLYKEECGFMNCHVAIHASANVDLPSHVIPIPALTVRTKRKRFRGNDPTNKQGGDARTNAELRIKKELEVRIKEASCERVKDSLRASLLERNTIFEAFDSILSQQQQQQQQKNQDERKELAEWIITSAPPPNLGDGCTSSLCTIHVTAWRNAIYVKGRYTKARRDCSQTPFFVPSNNNSGSEDKKNKMMRLGLTSVEEEICPIVAKVACGGISTLNNLGEDMQQGSGSKIVYGMAKFHASGREDMDVRMILPAEALEVEKTNLESNRGSKDTGSGRPFVLEIIDACELPSEQSLMDAVLAINHVTCKNDIVTLAKTSGSGEWVEEDDRMHVQYGVNPHGVGISGLEFCTSSSYRNLQSETEDKVKFYGCLCWCERPISSQEHLEDLLYKVKYPLEIHQATPLRVLHRRSTAVRTRHVLSLKARRLDNHWFRLSISTSAGTYVKEFCHGDCGRTIPSVSTLLGCKTDIVELDCEGIATN